MPALIFARDKSAMIYFERPILRHRGHRGHRGASCISTKRWGKQIVMRSDATSAVQLLECLAPVQLEERISRITLPTLLIHGDRDAIVPLSSSERLAALLPNSKLVVLAGAGHVPVVTRPAAVVGAIEAFFAPAER